jgi:hypothetical protein
MTMGCLLAFGEDYFDGGRRALAAAAWIIAFGALLTCGTRIHAIARQLKAR